jgi:hypothetical protein
MAAFISTELFRAMFGYPPRNCRIVACRRRPFSDGRDSEQLLALDAASGSMRFISQPHAADATQSSFERA